MVRKKFGENLALVWKKNLKPTLKFGGGSVLVWGCMSAKGVGNLVFIDGIMDKNVYLNIIQNNLAQSARKLALDSEYYSQQDNDPKHKSKLVMDWLESNVPNMLRTPPQSPDVNPIEHLWDHLEQRTRKHNITSKESLKAILEDEWRKILEEVTKNLVDSMPRRLDAVLKSKGYATKY